MRKQIILIVILSFLNVSYIRSQSASSTLPGDFGIFEVYDGRELPYADTCNGCYPLNINIIDNGNTLVLNREMTLYNGKRYKWTIKKTKVIGVFTAKSTHRLMNKGATARLEKDGSLTINYKNPEDDKFVDEKYETYGSGIVASYGERSANFFLAKGNSREKMQELSAIFGHLINVGSVNQIKYFYERTSLFRFVGLKDDKIKATGIIQGKFIMTLYDSKGKKLSGVEGSAIGTIKATLPSDSLYFITIVRDEESLPFILDVVPE